MYLLVEKVNDRNQTELKLDPGKPESAMLGYKQLPVKLLLFYIHLSFNCIQFGGGQKRSGYVQS